MGFLDLFIVALMPMLKILLITAVGLFLATERINLLGANARPYLNNVSWNFLLFNIGFLTNMLLMLLVKFQNQIPFASVKRFSLCCNSVSKSSCTYKVDNSLKGIKHKILRSVRCKIEEKYVPKKNNHIRQYLCGSTICLHLWSCSTVFLSQNQLTKP